MKNNITKKKIIFSSILGSILSLQLGAFSVVIETTLSQITELPFKTFVLVMQPIHLIIGLIEGIITSSVLCFIFQTRPELLWNPNKLDKIENKISYKKMMIILAICTIIIGGLISIFASANPDGLEWSIQKITGETELEAPNSKIYKISTTIQNITSILPDYSLKNATDSVGTSFSGLIGIIITIIVLYLVGYIIKLFTKKEKYNE